VSINLRLVKKSRKRLETELLLVTVRIILRIQMFDKGLR